MKSQTASKKKKNAQHTCTDKFPEKGIQIRLMVKKSNSISLIIKEMKITTFYRVAKIRKRLFQTVVTEKQALSDIVSGSVN